MKWRHRWDFALQSLSLLILSHKILNKWVNCREMNVPKGCKLCRHFQHLCSCNTARSSLIYKKCKSLKFIRHPGGLVVKTPYNNITFPVSPGVSCLHLYFDPFNNSKTVKKNRWITCFQGEEIHLPASSAAGQRGLPAELPDGGVSAPWPTVPRPHPASPPGNGPQAPAGAASPGRLHRERRPR